MKRPALSRNPWWLRAYRFALRVAPPAFRDGWGEDMLITFTDQVREAQRERGTTPRFLIVHELTNVLLTGLRERVLSSLRRLEVIHTQDIRYAFRLLSRSPGFALLTILVLAGGLGVSTFTFSFLYTAMVRSLPLNEGDRIVRITRLEQGRRRTNSPADLANIRPSLRTLVDFGGYTKHEVMLGRDNNTRVVSATITDPSAFKLARTAPLMGRSLLAADAEQGAEPVIVLSYRLWELDFAADRAALNTIVAVNGVSTRVVGVMPKGFGFPVTQDAWLPLAVNAGAYGHPSANRGDNEQLSAFARLAPGVTHAEAAAEVSVLLQRSIAARDTSGQNATANTAAVESFQATQFGDERMMVFTCLNVLASLILLLALVNVTTLLTARANERVRETAVRLALGASTGRLVMQGMWEGIILCVAGGVVGTACVAWGLDAITNWTRATMTGGVAFWWVWQMDRMTLLSAGAFVTVAIAVLGCVVSWPATRTNVREVMQDGSARSGSRREGRLSRLLVATQVTTVTVLMFVGALSAAMAKRMVTIDPGYDASRLLQAGFAPSGERFAESASRGTVFRDVQERLAQHVAIDGVLLRTQLARRTDRDASFALRDAQTSTQLPTATIFATLGAMSAVGITSVQGRMFDTGDDKAHAPVIVISRSLATRLWANRSAIGQQIRFAAVDDTTQWKTVVGVVSDVPYGDLLSRNRSTDAIYMPLSQSDAGYTDVIVRYRNNELAGRQALHQVFGAIDPQLVPGYVYRTSEVIRQSAVVTAGMAKLFGGCFAFALLLAVVGTYGLMSRTIGLRTREIGVRRALGATNSDATRMLLRQGARQLGVGTVVAAPILLAIGAATTYLSPLSAVLTATLGVLVSVAIFGVVLLATWLPTRKVLRVSLRDALWRE